MSLSRSVWPPQATEVASECDDLDFEFRQGSQRGDDENEKKLTQMGRTVVELFNRLNFVTDCTDAQTDMLLP